MGLEIKVKGRCSFIITPETVFGCPTYYVVSRSVLSSQIYVIGLVRPKTCITLGILKFPTCSMNS